MCSPHRTPEPYRRLSTHSTHHVMVIALLALLTPLAATAQTPDPYLGVPILTGGAPTPGGAVTFTNDVTIARSGAGVHGIVGSSTTGGYSEATLNLLRSFSAQPFSYVTDSVSNPDGTAGTLGQPVAGMLVDEDGNPLVDGDNNLLSGFGSFTLDGDGQYDFVRGDGFQGLVDALQPGQSVRTAIKFQATGTNTSNGVSRTSDGMLVVVVARAEDGTLTQSIGADYVDFGSSARPELAGDETVFPDLKAYVTSLLQFSHRGGVGSAVNVVNDGTITTSGTGAYGIYVSTHGQNGSNGRDASLFRSSRMGTAGGQGGAITITANGTIATCVQTDTGCTGADESAGVVAISVGGNGGIGGDSGWGRRASSGGPGANGATITILGNGTIRTGGAYSSGIFALSQGGDGGAGGGGSTFRGAANGAQGGAGGTILVDGSWNITTWSTESHGIFAKSWGGIAGSGGNGGWTGTSSGGGGQGTWGGPVTIINNGTITTHGSASHGIYGLSLGGAGGGGGSGKSIFYASGGSGASAGIGGAVSITNGTNGWIETWGEGSHGLFGQSIGGGGGSGGSGGALVGFGGGSASGGDGGSVTVVNQGTITAHGADSRGIYAQSVGGGGGDGGSSSGMVSFGGQGSATSNGGDVGVTNMGNVTATSEAIFAQSIGGGGGNGGSSKGWFSFGGSGGAGGNAGNVSVSSHGNLTTTGFNANAIFAESLGGGGGNGGNSTSVGAFVTVGIGGSGASGGTGGVARVGVNPSSPLVNPVIDPVTGILSTKGENANGIQVQSVGGGGGNGGFAVSVALGTGGSAAFGLGGSGGGGNSGGVASAYFGDSLSSIVTKGYKANGIFVQSIGGGGGNGGFSIAAAASQGFSASISIGGNGGTGGAGGAVTVGDALHPMLGSITTEGGSSSTVVGARGLAHGIFAQSVGGGGGSGGMSIAGGLAPAALNFAMGGKGAGGGSASTVDVTTGATITTKGANSHGVFAQSVGGGGGAGGFSLSVGAAAVNVGVSLGGNGGAGGAGSTVTASNTGLITTMGPLSHGMFAQSVGGGGGAGGFAIAGSLSMSGALDFALGGKGGTGGNSGAVTVTNSGTITTGFPGDTSVPPPPDDPNDPFLHSGRGSKGIVAQSVGGGGGAGGFGGAFSLQFNPTNYPSGSLSIGIGGNGGGAGASGAVSVTNSGSVTTKANDSAGIFAQSVGGGGGDAGFGLSVSMSASAGKSAAVGVAIGGKGTSGGNGNTVTATNTKTITTTGDRSEGIFAQSVGGGGGNGGAAISMAAALSADQSFGASVAIGGDGAGGGIGQHVTVTNDGAIDTSGDYSIGIRAQSIGGGGGNGGLALSLSVAGPPAKVASVAVGGSGGAGGTGGQVDIFGAAASSIWTRGDYAHGIQAQSIGGGGGDGGSSTSLSLGVGGFTGTTVNVGAAVGGTGGTGNIGQAVNVGTELNPLRGSITTEGQDSVGIFAQSIGGGGGTGGSSVEGTLTGAPARSGTTVNLNLAVGGHGGSGNNGGAVQVYHDGAINTWNDGSHGIEAQSIGGGGGSGGSARAVNLQLGTSPLGSRGTTGALTLSVGASGAGGGDGGTVIVSHVGDITTRGGDAYAIFAQSIGGGGGSGGDGHRGIPGDVDDIVTKVFRKSSFLKSASLIVGGSQGAFGHGNAVSVSNTGAITTYGDGSHAVLAQSIGGGGGIGGSGVTTTAGDADAGASPGLFSLMAGGGGGAGGNGGLVTVNLAGSVTTYGHGANAIFAESVGGGGGSAGGIDRGFKNWLNIGMGVGLGQDGGSSGDGGTITVTSTANIFTRGDGSNGIFAHSVGGGGGLIGGMGNEQGGILEPLKYLNFAGSVGGKGSGGMVTVNQTGDITTLGDSADGIFAQSAGGVADETHGGTGGLGRAVSVTLNSGNIIASGADSNGIFAQSRGEAGNGNVSISILDLDSTVVGGSNGGAAIRLADGNQNTITNRGILTTQDAIKGTVILGTGGHDHVTNWGGVVGSVDLGTGANTFDNKDRAVFLAGSTVNLGAAGLFSNAGMLSLGGAGLLQTTAVTGDFAQAGTPRWMVDIGEIGHSDALVVSGKAQLGTSVTTIDIHEMLTPAGSGSYALLSAASGLSGATFRFGTMYGAMPVGQTFDFANSDTRHDLTLLPSVGPFQWTGTMGGDWTTPFVNGISNWTRTGGTDYVYGTPGAGSDVIFTAAGQTFMGADFTINSLTFTGGGSHSLVDPHTLTLMGGGGTGLSVGDSAALGVNLVLGGDQSWWNSGYLLVNGPMISGSGRHLTVDGSGTTIISSPIHTGAGSLTKAGSGLLVLRGGNTYRGGTSITGGTLLGDTFSLQGNIANQAELVFDQAFAGTFAGDITGTGWLVKQSGGVLRLAGVNTYSGGTLVGGGTLIGNSLGVQGNILNESQVIFDQDVTGTYAGSMTGGGTLIKQGAGALFMTGNSWPFTGSATVSAGQLFVNGLLGGSSLTMRPGTLLGGSGIVTNTTIQRGAVLAPGNSIGVLQVIGDLRLDPGSIYRIETEAYGLSDVALVSGQVFADGATLEIQATGARRYRPINFYRMFETGRGVSGTFSNITMNLGYLDPSVQYNGNTVEFTLRRNDVDFRDMGTRGNQTSVALALNRLVSTATGGLASVVNNVYDLTDGEALTAMNSMSGLLYQHTARNALDLSRAFAGASLRRLGLVARDNGRPLANAGFGVSGAMSQSPALADERYGAWFSGIGGVTRYHGSSVDAAAKAPARGIIGGFDAAVTDTLTLGVSGGRAWPEVTLDGTSDRSTSTLTNGNVYGRYTDGKTRIDGVVGFSRVDHEGFRTITDGVSAVAAESSNRGRGIALQLEYGRSFDAGRGFTFEPGAGLQFGQLRLDGFTEHGGDVLALVVPARTARSQRLLTGGRIGKSLDVFSGTRMIVEARAAWAHEFRRLDNVSVRFSADPFANEFAIAPPNDQRDSAVLGLGFAADAGAHLRIFADIGGEVGGPSRIWAGTVGVSRAW